MTKSIIRQEILDGIQTCIKGCVKPVLTEFVSDRKQAYVKVYQKQLHESLKRCIDGVWEKEYKYNLDKNRRDSIDVYGECDGIPVVIEIDTMRADQLAKKMISRFAGFLDRPILYIAICYPGTESMSRGECVKYFEYGRMVLTGINHESIFLGCIIEDDLNVVFNPEK